jgi:glycosyltransferase involved in cell wall biosynthesis
MNPVTDGSLRASARPSAAGARRTAKALSIVVPVFNEERVVPELHRRLQHVLDRLEKECGLAAPTVEVLFVNDGSADGTLDLLRGVCDGSPSFVVINLSRNFGHQMAITAGVDHAAGDAVVFIDGDLQDPPEFIVDLYRKLHEGFDVVYAVRRRREGETWFKRLTAAAFYRLMRRLTTVDIPLDTGDFRIISRRVVDVLSSMRESDRFIRGMTSWVGFRQVGILYDRQQRFAGLTKFTPLRMLKFSLDAVTSFSAVPLKLVTILGFSMALLAFVLGVVTAYLKLFTTTTVQGWSSIIIVVLFMGGLQLLSIGMIGEYLKRVSDQTKNRPLYVIEGVYGGDVDD